MKNDSFEVAVQACLSAKFRCYAQSRANDIETYWKIV